MTPKNKHKKTGFTTPKNYFKCLEEGLLSKLYLDNNFKEKTGFNVPDNYFEKLDDRLINTIKKSKETKVISIFNTRKFYSRVSAAAIIILCLFVLNSIYSEPDSFDDLEYSTIEEYINTENINISNLEIAELYGIQLTDLDHISFLNLKDDIILDYILEETTTDYYYESDL